MMMKPPAVLLLALLRSAVSLPATTNDVLEANVPRHRAQGPFLSTTLATRISAAVRDDDDELAFDAARRSLFADTLTRFLAKVFRDQQAYAVKILGAHVFDDRVDAKEAPPPRDGKWTRSFATVVTAEYTRADEFGHVADDAFRDMLVHVCDKFQDHLLRFLGDTGDGFLGSVDGVLLAEFEKRPGSDVADVTAKSSHLGLSDEALDIASIVAIAVGGVVFVVLSLASVRYYR